MKNQHVIRIVLPLIVTVCWTTTVMSQEIRGKVVDDNLVPISGATIVLQTTDSTFVDAVISEEDGTFTFSRSIVPFLLTVQHVAYKTIQQRFYNPDIGTIKMTPNEVLIDEIVVTSQRPYAKIKKGRIIYDLKEITQNKVVGSAWDLLNKLPGVSSNGSSVSLICANKVSIMIDGRLSTLTVEQLYTVLSSTPANRVEKVEVIYNAPPQYHVKGSVINLIMRHSANSLTECEVVANFANQYFSDGGLNTNFRVAASKMTLDVMYGINNKKSIQYSKIASCHSLHGALYNVIQTEKVSSKYWEHDIRTSFDYRFNDTNDINITYTAILSPSKDNQSHTVGNYQTSINKKDINTNVHNFALGSKLWFGLSAGVDYTHYNLKDRQNLNIEYSDGSIGKVSSSGEQTIDKYAIYVDKSHTFNDGWNIGYGASFMNLLDRDYQHYNVTESSKRELNTDLKLREHKVDLYLSASRQFEKGLSFSASLKGEYYKMGSHKRWSLYPQFSVTYIENPKHVCQLSFSTDKTYPKYWTMLSSISYVDGYSEIHGSPGILPSMNYNLNLTYILNSKYIVGAFYLYSKDYFAQSPYQSTERLALIYKNVNWNYMQNAGVNVIVPVNVGNWLKTRIMAVGMYMRQRCDNFFDISFDRNKLALMGRVDNSFIVNNNILLELNANIQSPVIQGTFDIGTMASVDAGARWNFAREKISLNVWCNDIFNTSSPKLTVNYKGQNIVMNNSFYSRSINVKLIYKLGGFKRKKEKEIDISRYGH